MVRSLGSGARLGENSPKFLAGLPGYNKLKSIVGFKSKLWLYSNDLQTGTLHGLTIGRRHYSRVISKRYDASKKYRALNTFKACIIVLKTPNFSQMAIFS